MLMLTSVTRRVALGSFGFLLIAIMAACNPRQLSISATDRVYVPSAKERAEQEARQQGAEVAGAQGRPGPESPPALAPATKEQESSMVGGTGPLEEVRVAEPPIPPPGAPQSTGPSSGSSAGDSSGGPTAGSSAGSSSTAPLVAQAMPGDSGSAGTSSGGQSGAGQASKISLEDVFFDFDRFAIRSDAKPVLEANAAALKSEPNVKILIEGHCDERGTSEYNLVLGEKRARAARQYLQGLGIEASRIQITSFGKERPFCFEHDPVCFQKNRRAHFVVP